MTEWGPGTNTGHGHVWPRLDGARVRCGGPGVCRECSADAARIAGRIDGDDAVAAGGIAMPSVPVEHAAGGHVLAPVNGAAGRMVELSLRAYPARLERAAMRSGMSDAAHLCDEVARHIRAEHTVRGKVTKLGRQLAAVAKLCGDAVWQMREMVPPGDGANPHGAGTPVALSLTHRRPGECPRADACGGLVPAVNGAEQDLVCASPGCPLLTGSDGSDAATGEG